ncbi:WW domain-binding protein 2 [Trichoplax sp. H2]|uniref:GRAM domain-containing protein n=1 Tax=Trichoplax adhaerens TaxID=10228 RepID=B3RMF7_TRIAD|nr:expressed hypothetical protein [Trichoplax adhaerens]EDV27843.1 expressed hypothetical protein [Trichoplax adhaerens]RDD41592.1 WW domain-binding protein 2 [Trichoplax sp. H2]|eukprot:XP_002109677.1 expressed hypothetical protein [Trichoplax adhaerens]
MAINKTYADGQLKLLVGETILLNYKGVELTLDGTHLPKEFHGNHKGVGYLSNYRIIFATSMKSNDHLRSIAMPFNCLRNVELKQPIFGSNHLRGTCIPDQEETAFRDSLDFKMYFTSGGAIEFGTMYTRMVRGGGTVAAPQLSAISPAVLAQAQAAYGPRGGCQYVYYQGGATAPTMNAYPPPPNAAAMPNAATAYYSPSNPNNLYAPTQGMPANPPAYSETEKKKE